MNKCCYLIGRVSVLVSPECGEWMFCCFLIGRRTVLENRGHVWWLTCCNLSVSGKRPFPIRLAEWVFCDFLKTRCVPSILISYREWPSTFWLAWMNIRESMALTGVTVLLLCPDWLSVLLSSDWLRVLRLLQDDQSGVVSILSVCVLPGWVTVDDRILSVIKFYN